jgi:hypothetical protein
MRPDPPVSVRQKRLPAKTTATQRQTQEDVQLSERQRKGFKSNAQAIARRQGLPYERAAAILAASTRRASASAKRKNPALRKVKGKAK